jgi:uncharacterized protein
MQKPIRFHSGELAVQLRAGEKAIADRHSQLILGTILEAAKPFLEDQFMVVLASTDSEGAAWSSILYGYPGFAYATGDSSLHIDVSERDTSDPIWANILQNPEIGLLFIDLGSRRRYRINGQVESMEENGLNIAVSEAFPNCPKYIQKRQLTSIAERLVSTDTASGIGINEQIAPLIRNADTLFVATSNAQSGADASHRGGEPGFVQIVDGNTLRIPDFSGNSLYSTLGNIETNPNTGICIPDFTGQKLLQLTGQARILWDQDDPENLTGGTKRFWELKIDRWVLRHIPQYLEWEFLAKSPFNPPVKRG